MKPIREEHWVMILPFLVAFVCFVLVEAKGCQRESQAATPASVVRITRTGECFHRPGCQWAGLEQVSREEAEGLGLRACGVCRP